jgi:hypothetical protein
MGGNRRLGTQQPVSEIVAAAVYPPIGIARVGNSETEFFLGPETLAPVERPPGFCKDPKGALKRQGARFRVFGLDKDGHVVQELDAKNSEITWTVHVANKKAAWFEFDVALDIPQAKPVSLRNANFTGDARKVLVIDPGPMSISGVDESGARYRLDKGSFLGVPVSLGELRTDEAGRLIFLGGHGVSGTPFPNNPPTTFANNDGWYDDVSDGPVDATVAYQGRELPVEGAWVACCPPNYAPDLISVQTMYDVVVDALTGYYLPRKERPSFTNDIYPLLLQLSTTQWVNEAFYVAFGHAQRYDFANEELIRKLATVTPPTDPDPDGDVYREYRRQIFNAFRPNGTTEIDARLWPWMYGDNMAVPATTANGYFTLTDTLYGYLRQWQDGGFEQDWTGVQEPVPLESLDPRQQAEMLTKAALWYCLGGPFHPGCELTWPMRLVVMYSGPFRIRRRSDENPEPDYDGVLSPAVFQDPFTTAPGVCWNGPGDLTRWMACPWQTDTASCRAGYEKAYDPLIPTFWPTHVPNTVLTEEDYEIVVDTTQPAETRIEAFNRRATWLRILGSTYIDAITHMVDRFGALGVVERRDGVRDLPALPRVMYVESTPWAPGAHDPAALGPAAREAVQARTAKAERAKRIPRNRGRWIGRVGRAARTR